MDISGMCERGVEQGSGEKVVWTRWVLCTSFHLNRRAAVVLVSYKRFALASNCNLIYLFCFDASVLQQIVMFWTVCDYILWSDLWLLYWWLHQLDELHSFPDLMFALNNEHESNIFLIANPMHLLFIPILLTHLNSLLFSMHNTQQLSRDTRSRPPPRRRASPPSQSSKKTTTSKTAT
jgi:hypothetical protein